MTHPVHSPRKYCFVFFLTPDLLKFHNDSTWIRFLLFSFFFSFSPMIFSVCRFCNAYSSLWNLRLTLFCYLFSYCLLYFCFAFCKIFSTLSSNSSVEFFFSYDIFICRHSFLFLNILSYCILFLPPYMQKSLFYLYGYYRIF